MVMSKYDGITHASFMIGQKILHLALQQVYSDGILRTITKLKNFLASGIVCILFTVECYLPFLINYISNKQVYLY